MNPSYRLFLDLDGVLADFDTGVLQALGKLPNELPPPKLWPALAAISDFYAHLPWMSDGRELWNFCRPFQPIILTGLPLGRWAEPQKRAWCARELGPDVPVLCCLSRDKAKRAAAELQADEIPVLVDDRLKFQSLWTDAGGIFVWHQTAAASITALGELGWR